MSRDGAYREARTDLESGRGSGIRVPRTLNLADPEPNLPFDCVTVILDKTGGRIEVQRPCLHALAGRVAKRVCTLGYRCDSCEFDRLVEETHLPLRRRSHPTVVINGYQHSEQCQYHRGHTWTLPEHGGNMRIGLDDFAARLIGHTDAIELPSPGSRILAGEPCFAFRRDRHWVKVLAPIAGIVVSINEEVVRSPGLVHRNAFDEGWLALVKPERKTSRCPPLLQGEEAKEWMVRECDFFQVLLRRGFGGRTSTDQAASSTLVSDWAWIMLVETFLHTRVARDLGSVT